MILSTNKHSLLVLLSIFTLALARGQHVRDLTVRQATEDSASMTSSASPASTSNPVVLFIYILDQMTTCQSGNISWNYAGPAPAQLTLKITDVNVNQSSATTLPPTVTRILESNIVVNDTSGNWTWRQVNVSSGYYVVEGSVNDTSTQSEPFFVANGSDTSCILSQTSPSMSTSTSTSTPSSTSAPTIAKKINVGAIVGGVVGGAIIIAAILALLFFRNYNRPSRSRRANNVRWPKFPSTDSQDPFTRVKFNSSKSSGQWGSSDEHRSTESIGSKLNVIAAAASTDPCDNDEKEASPSSTKSSVLNSVTPLSFDNRQISASSSASHPPNYSRPRVPSTRNSARNSADASPIDVQSDSQQRSSLDILDARVERLPSVPSMPPSTYHSRKSSSEMTPLGRSASTQSTSARRSSRKPVPRYDTFELDSSNNVDLPPLNLDPSPVSGLKHKLSFGDVRPVHFLIPDMPPPSKS